MVFFKSTVDLLLKLVLLSKLKVKRKVVFFVASLLWIFSGNFLQNYEGKTFFQVNEMPNPVFLITVTLNFGENDSQMGTRIDSSLSSSSTRKSTLTPPTNHTPFMNATVVTTAKQMQLACNQTHSSNVKSETPPTSAADFRSRDNYDNVVSATTSDMRPPSNAVRMRVCFPIESL